MNLTHFLRYLQKQLQLRLATGQAETDEMILASLYHTISELTEAAEQLQNQELLELLDDFQYVIAETQMGA